MQPTDPLCLFVVNYYIVDQLGHLLRMNHYVFIHSFIHLLVSPPQMVVATGGRSAKSTGGGPSCPGSLESTPQIPMLLRVPYMDYRDGCVGRGVLGLGILLQTKALCMHILSGHMVGNGGPSARSPW